MFTLNWNDPQVYWLNVTNWILLLVTVVCVVILAAAVAREVLRRVRSRMPIGVREPLDAHVAAYPDLGFTMADGGERVEPDNRKPRSFRRDK